MTQTDENGGRLELGCCPQIGQGKTLFYLGAAYYLGAALLKVATYQQEKLLKSGAFPNGVFNLSSVYI